MANERQPLCMVRRVDAVIGQAAFGLGTRPSLSKKQVASTGVSVADESSPIFIRNSRLPAGRKRV